MAENEFLKMFQQQQKGSDTRRSGGARTPKRPSSSQQPGNRGAEGSTDDPHDELDELSDKNEMLEKQIELLVSNASKAREKEAEAREMATRLQAQLQSAQLELDSKQHIAQSALTDTRERQARITMLEQQLLSTQHVLDSLDAQRAELERLVSKQDERLGLAAGRPQQLLERIEQLERAKRDATGAFDSERDMLQRQIQQRESDLEAARSGQQHALDVLKSRYDTQLEQLSNQHDALMLELQASYEKRLKGLTDALSASLNDTELVNELRREHERTLEDSTMRNERDLQRVKQRLQSLETEHRGSLFDIVNTDRNEVRRMQQFIERLNKQFATLLEEEKALIPDEQHEHAQLLDTISLELQQLQEEQANKMANERSEGGPGDEMRHMRELVDWEIQVVNAMHRAMANVLRHQRATFTAALRDKTASVDRLHDENFAQAKELVECRQRILDQEKTIAELRRQLAQLQYAGEVGVVELRAQLDERQHMVDAMRQKQIELEQGLRDSEQRQHEAEHNVRQFTNTAQQQNAVIARLHQLLADAGGPGRMDKIIDRIRNEMLDMSAQRAPTGADSLSVATRPAALYGTGSMRPSDVLYSLMQSGAVGGPGARVPPGHLYDPQQAFDASLPLDEVLRTISYRTMADRLAPHLPPAPNLDNFPMLNQLFKTGRLFKPRPKPAQVGSPFACTCTHTRAHLRRQR
eukprot:TRINITY_DN3066_c0_g4_i3.p1 TRINITY_DN3066_c0_g4~~TRINITY_DN3066_c0_g4_i3.p1  ORF type:complete len:696 (-),score=345.88 TRINITY_DN3066_c0_g4_i3:48-2135(-)